MKRFSFTARQFILKIIFSSLLIFDSKICLGFWILRVSLASSPDKQINDNFMRSFSLFISLFFFCKMAPTVYYFLKSNKIIKFGIMKTPFSFWVSQFFLGSYSFLLHCKQSFNQIILDIISVLITWQSNKTCSSIIKMKLSS